MTPNVIVESKMKFGPFAEGECFHIEKSQVYQAIQRNVKTAEFLLLRFQNDKQVIWVVEAKSSSPRPETQPNFSEFIDDVRNKITNAFLLGIAVRLRRHSTADTELPGAFTSLDLQSIGFRFVLVVQGHKQEWLVPLQNALSLALNPIVKIWALPPNSVAVINDELARQYKLIQ
jgi:hypothetical protein